MRLASILAFEIESKIKPDTNKSKPNNIRLATRIAVGRRGTSPVSAYVATNGMLKPIEVKRHTEESEPNMKSGRFS